MYVCVASSQSAKSGNVGVSVIIGIVQALCFCGFQIFELKDLAVGVGSGGNPAAAYATPPVTLILRLCLRIRHRLLLPLQPLEVANPPLCSQCLPQPSWCLFPWRLFRHEIDKGKEAPSEEAAVGRAEQL